MTPRQREEYRLSTYAEREQLREIAQTVPCPEPPLGCGRPADEPCVNRIGEPLKHMDHTSRLRRAQAAKDPS
ncbi:hypothetical protein EV192_101712 [Actinocrispum wychmicini]|uniref:DNA-binding phage zinc finger domain-containing protein n=2 Tax=Actinocrispum wychmicini TaxID=1213861 RepID=A0A4R2K570_9PSEU|nr:hypothetical protein EV192_101712 [Actinocrispum wychmicini]